MKKIAVSIALSAGLPLLSYAEVESNEHLAPLVRTSFSIRFKKSQDLDFNKNFVYPKWKPLLDLYRAKIDHQSEIKIHEEDSYIDFSCFDCIIRNYDYENELSMPDNKGGGERG